MKIVAITRNGSEFIYSAKSAHRVAQNKIAYVLEVLNKYRYLLKDDTENGLHMKLMNMTKHMLIQRISVFQ